MVRALLCQLPKRSLPSLLDVYVLPAACRTQYVHPSPLASGCLWVACEEQQQLIIRQQDSANTNRQTFVGIKGVV